MSGDEFKPTGKKYRFCFQIYMFKITFSEHPHIRYNPLKGEWVLVSPHRTLRPWMGKIENIADEDVPEFDSKNPLCPGVTRPNGEVRIDKVFSL